MPKFKLISGVHSEGGRTYLPGEIIESRSDLSKHNHFPDRRYEPVAEGDGFDSMTIAELKQHAEEEEVDLGMATKKAEILRLVRGEAIAEPAPA